MKTSHEILLVALVATAGLGLLEFGDLLAMEHPKANQWTLQERFANDSRLRFAINRTQGDQQSTWSFDIDRAQLQGLPSGNLRQWQGQHRFLLRRDSGTLTCEGTFASGRGSGSYTVERNPNFRPQLEQLGFSASAEPDDFALLFSGLTVDYARLVAGSGLLAQSNRPVSVQELNELFQNGVSSELLRASAEAGFPRLETKDILEFHRHAVTPALLRELRLGKFSLTPSELVELRQHGVNEDYLRKIARYRQQHYGVQLARLKVHGVQPEFLHALADYGHTQLPADQVINLHHHGVNEEFLRGYRLERVFRPAADLIQLKDHGVPANLVAVAGKLGLQDAPASDWVRLSQQGCDADFLEGFARHGLRAPAQVLLKLRNHGVDADYVAALLTASQPVANKLAPKAPASPKPPQELSPELVSQIVDLKNHGVPADFVQQVAGMGFQFQLPEYRQLHNRGVNADYLRTLQNSGYRPLTPEVVIKLKDHGIN